jgi:hypothetical protein
MGEKTPRSKHYLNFVRQMPCVVCETSCEIHTHHVRLGGHSGMGMKPSDFRTIPLCRTHHAECHQHGEATFIQKYKLNIGNMINKCLLAYASSLNMDTFKMSDAMAKAIENEKMDERISRTLFEIFSKGDEKNGEKST